MNKGLIMEIKDEYAIVMCDNGIMNRILIKPGMSVGQKIFFFEEDIIKNTVSTTPAKKTFNINTFMKSFGSIAALFLIVFTVFQNIMVDKAYAIVSIDINPSIELTTNNKKNIIKVDGKNVDGQDADFQEIKGMNINDGIKRLKEILVEKNYLDENRDVLVAVGFPNDECDAEYVENVQEIVVSTFDSENVACVKVNNKEDIKEANEKGISLGRYEAYKLADDSKVKENIKDAPVKELTAQIKDQENVAYWDSNSDEANKVEATDSIKDEKQVETQGNNKDDSSSVSQSQSQVSEESNKKQEDKLPAASSDGDSNSAKEQSSASSSSSTASNEPQEIELKPEAPSQSIDQNHDNSAIDLKPEPQPKPEIQQPQKSEENQGQKPNNAGTDSANKPNKDEETKGNTDENSSINAPKAQKEIIKKEITIKKDSM